MYKKLIIFSCFILYTASLFSQNEKGYNIRIELTDREDETLFITGNYGYDFFIFDSAQMGKGIALFKHKDKIIPDGIYQLTNRRGDSYFEFIVDKDRNFQISTSAKNPYLKSTISNSEENVVFFEYQKMKMFNEELPQNYIDNFTETSPNSLISIYIKANEFRPNIPDFYQKDGITPDTFAGYLYLKKHFFDNITFSDSRILHVPVNYGIDLFFGRIISQKADSINREIDQFMANISDEEIRNYFLRHLLHLFDNDNPAYDAVLVHLFDTFCPNGQCEWLDENSFRRFSRNIKRKRITLPGEKIPELAAYDRNEQIINTKDIDNSIIILWFWDPDCDDCLEQTPKLFQFYKTYKNVYDIEVYAVSVTEDLDRWEHFIDENRLDWVNVSYAKGEPNYEFIDYFDLITTPGIFLIDKNHIIIDRQFPLDDLLEKIENYNK